MNAEYPYRLEVSFPGELTFIPLVRKLVADTLGALEFNARFTFRSELIIDELCNNAVNYGASIDRSPVEILCTVFEDRVEFSIKDRGGSAENITRLRMAIAAQPAWSAQSEDKARGLELVRILSESVSCTIGKNNLTQIHVVRKRNEGE